MKKLTNKALKEIVSKIENELNNKETYQLENGCWLYKLELKKNEIVVKIFDSEINEYYLQYAFVIDIAEDIVTLIKSMISYLYENEINDKQSYIKSNRGYFNRKHKSLSLWLDRSNKDKVNKLTIDIANRYKVTKKYESEIGTYKSMVTDFYNCMTTLSPSWRMEDLKESIFKKLEQLGIKNVGISYIDNTLYVMQSDDKAEKIINKAEIYVDSYINKNMIVTQVVNRLNNRKVA